MGKGAIRVSKKKGTNNTVTFDPRLSTDKRCLVLRQETTQPMFYEEHLQCIIAWCHQEIEDMGRKEGESLN